MSPSVHDEEEWLDLANLEISGSAIATPTGTGSQAAPGNVSITSKAISKSPVLKAGMPGGSLPKSAELKTTCTETPLYRSMRENADKLLIPGASIFHVDLGGDYHTLRDAFTNGLPAEYRQEFNCSACHRFMKRFGDLSLVDAKTGHLMPLFWKCEIQNEFYQKPVEAVENLFRGRKVREAFLVTKKTINAGTFESGGFDHMNFKFPTQRLRKAEPKGFASATIVDLATMLDRVLADNQVSTIHQAADLILEDKLSYADKHKGAIRWLRDLVNKGQLTDVSISDDSRHNLLHLAAADSFLGCIHQLRSGALSTLLEDIERGLSFTAIRSKWSGLADPIAYMRPTAPPSAGNIAAAEKLFSELGLSLNDLKRKYLLVEDIPQEVIMWRSPAIPKQSSGIFSNLTPKSKPSTCSSTATNDDPSIPPTSLTFASFMNRIVPLAKTIEYNLSSRPPLYFLVTGLPGTNPLMQWHTRTNLVSHYTYHVSYPARQHNLKPGWAPITAIIPAPTLWEGVPATTTLPLSDELTQGPNNANKGKGYKHAHHGFRYFFCLQGIEDEAKTSCLFPTFLRKELHGIRSTIEAYSDGLGIERVSKEGPMVGGIAVDMSQGKTGKMEHLVRVRDAAGRWSRYRITLFQ